MFRIQSLENICSSYTMPNIYFVRKYWQKMSQKRTNWRHIILSRAIDKMLCNYVTQYYLFTFLGNQSCISSFQDLAQYFFFRKDNCKYIGKWNKFFIFYQEKKEKNILFIFKHLWFHLFIFIFDIIPWKENKRETPSLKN